MYREFIIQKIVAESTQIKSFYLSPLDKMPLDIFLPGQFLTLKIPLPHTPEALIRTYTVSSKPKETYYRITVKHEPRGKASSALHNHAQVGDVLQVRPPAGQFHLNIRSTKPIMMISAGVGITPMLSMLAYIAYYQPQRSLTFLHSSRNVTEQIASDYLKELANKLPHLRLQVHHSQPLASEQSGMDFDVVGRITQSVIASLYNSEIEAYYLCGPLSFMEAMHRYLLNLGVSPPQITYEFFGTSKKLGA